MQFSLLARVTIVKNNFMAMLSKILIYPIKSLDAVEVAACEIALTGALRNDRIHAILDTHGNYVNGKRNAAVHKLRSDFGPALQTLTLSHPGAAARTFQFPSERAAIEEWLSVFFGFKATLASDESGYPDDTDSPGPTVIGTATLEAVASWFPGMSLDEARRRFRANLEIGGTPPFWEDRLFSELGESVRFQIGDVVVEGVNPCQRCVVPSRDSMSGESMNDFQKVFIEKRKASLPPWANAARFNHFYRLAVNTRIVAQAGKCFRIGDVVKSI